MNETDIEEFAKSLTVTASIFKENLSNEILKIYFDILKRFNIKEVKKALTRHIETSKFFPKPSEIIELISIASNKTAEDAWIKLLSAISKYGYYHSVEFDDKIIHTCIRAMGGWCAVSDRLQDTWMHKDFISFYESFKLKPDHAERIAGHLELAGGRYTVAYVGNKDKRIEIAQDNAKNDNYDNFRERLKSLVINKKVTERKEFSK